jgi:hypothetical protein
VRRRDGASTPSKILDEPLAATVDVGYNMSVGTASLVRESLSSGRPNLKGTR